MVRATGNHSPAIRRIRHGKNWLGVPAERLQLLTYLPLPKIPFEPALGSRGGFFQQLPDTAHVVLLPRGLRQIHLVDVELTDRVGLAAFSLPSQDDLIPARIFGIVAQPTLLALGARRAHC